MHLSILLNIVYKPAVTNVAMMWTCEAISDTFPIDKNNTWIIKYFPKDDDDYTDNSSIEFLFIYMLTQQPKGKVSMSEWNKHIHKVHERCNL
jgi:hypothetical protein